MANSTNIEHVNLLVSAKSLTKTLLAFIYTRLHLLAIDIEEDRLYLLHTIKYGLLALFCMLIGMSMLTVFIVVLFWDSHRLLALGTISGVFWIAGYLFWRYAVVKAKEKSSVFATTLSELLKDCQSLEDRVFSQEKT